MARGTLTVANSVFTLVVPGIFPAPFRVQGYSADDVFSTEAVQTVQTLMGVDGLLSAGYVAVERQMGLTLQADSPSVDAFETWAQTQDFQLDAFSADGSIELPGLGRIFTLTKGFLTSYNPIPNARKILEPRRYAITWEKILGAPI